MKRKIAKRLMSTAFSVAALFLVALFTVQANAAPQGPWLLPAQDLSAPGEDSGFQQVAVGQDGTAVAVWVRDNGFNDIVQAAVRPPGGSFGPPEDLSAPGQDAYEPKVAFGPGGKATAIWSRFNGSEYIVQAADRPKGGSFGAPVDVSQAGSGAGDQELAVGPDGTAIAVWYRSDGSDDRVQAAIRPPGGSFAASVNLSAAGGNATQPYIAFGPGGNATAVWVRSVGGDKIVQAAYWSGGPSFGIPVDLSLAGGEATDPRVAIGGDGSATAAWYRSNGVNYIAQAAIRPSGGGFGMPVDLSAPGQNAFGLELAADPNGNATAIWTRFNGSEGITQVSTRPKGGTFGPALDLSAPGQDSKVPDLATSPDGTTTAVWARFNGSNAVIQASTRPPGGAFGSPVDISGLGAGLSASSPDIAVGPDGVATAVWYRWNGSNDITQSASTKAPQCGKATLKLSKVKRNRRTGTANLTVKVGAAGELSIKGTRSLEATSKELKSKGQARLTVRPKGKAARTLKRRGSYRLKVKVNFKPAGCSKKSKSKKVKLLRRR